MHVCERKPLTALESLKGRKRCNLRVYERKPLQVDDDDKNDAEDVNFTVVKTVRALENYESTPFLALVYRNLVAVRTKGRLNLAIN